MFLYSYGSYISRTGRCSWLVVRFFREQSVLVSLSRQVLLPDVFTWRLFTRAISRMLNSQHFAISRY